MTQQALYIGSKLKKLRRDRNINQKNLALELGISASYLNLIERNRRGLTANLLLKLADIFDINVNELSQNTDVQLSNDLSELLADDMFGDFAITNQDITDLTAENPEIGKAMIRLFDKYNMRQKQNQKLINQFITGVEGDAGQFDNEASPEYMAELVSDFIQSQSNYFAPLEQAAERVRLDVDLMGEGLFHGLKAFAINSFAIRTIIMELPDDESAQFDTETGILNISNFSTEHSQIFCLAEHIGLYAAKNEIDDIIEQANFEDERINNYLEQVLSRYFAACIMMPYDGFLKRAKQTRYDIDLLCHYFNVSFEQACHRLTSMQKPGAKAIPFHFVRTDIAGHISKRFSLSGIKIPRYGTACPRWNIYAAFMQPGRINVQLSETPDGQVYFCIARTITKGVRRFGKPLRHFSIGLGCKYIHAKSMVYSDSVDLKDAGQLVRIGATCPVCQRHNCSLHNVD
uniref:XRE family transcriptional regulator n=1 Tax=OCS116 cluster bacterium TaxID=2030921 RepID=A0A2A4Z9I0_9PROT